MEIILPQRICIHGFGLVLKQPATSRKKIDRHVVSHADSPWAVVFHASLYETVLLCLIFRLQDLGGRGGVGETDSSVFAHGPGQGQWGITLGHPGDYCTIISVDTKTDNSDIMCR